MSPGRTVVSGSSTMVSPAAPGSSVAAGSAGTSCTAAILPAAMTSCACSRGLSLIPSIIRRGRRMSLRPAAVPSFIAVTLAALLRAPADDGGGQHASDPANAGQVDPLIWRVHAAASRAVVAGGDIQVAEVPAVRGPEHRADASWLARFLGDHRLNQGDNRRILCQ